MKIPKYPTVTDRPIRLGLVGCGRISKSHFKAIEQLSQDIHLVSLCDIEPEVLKTHKDQYKVSGHASIGAMLAKERLDLISLCTPSGLHPQQTLLAAQHGVHVLTEKPMGTRLADGVAMVNVCEQAGVRLFVVKQNRFNTTLQFLKKAVDQGRFGNIYNIAVNVFWTRPQEYYDQGGGWRGTWGLDGGAFMNQASHYIDLLNWIMGPVESVMAYTATQARHIEAEDSGVAAIKWRSGAMGTINVSMLTYPQNLEGSITILGENGTAKIGGLAVNEIQEWHFADTRPEDALVNNFSYATKSVYGFGHLLYYQNVVNVFRGYAEPETDGRSGLKSLELLEAIYRSARDGIKVSLPLEV